MLLRHLCFLSSLYLICNKGKPIVDMQEQEIEHNEDWVIPHIEGSKRGDLLKIYNDKYIMESSNVNFLI